MTDKDTHQGRSMVEIKRQPMVVSGPNILTDTAKFEHLQRVATLMSQSNLVPEHFRGHPADCFLVCQQADRWQMDPFMVAQKTYAIKGKLGYEAQLVTAVINSRAPLKSRINTRYEGDGVNRVCVVWATLEGEDEPREKRSPALKDITIRNSPMWQLDADQQQGYWTQRAWCRLHCPDILLGVYVPEELEQMEMFRGPDNAKDITPRPSRSAQPPASAGDVIDSTSSEPAEEAEPEQKFEFVDETGVVESTHATADTWAQEFFAACTGGNVKAPGYFKANAEAAQNVLPLLNDAALWEKVSAILKDPPKEPPKPKPAEAETAKSERSAQAGAPESGKTDAAEGPKVQPGAPAPEKPAEEPKAIEYPKTPRGGLHHGNYFQAIIKEIGECNKPGQARLIVKREQPNLAKTLGGTRRSIEIEADRKEIELEKGAKG